MFKRILVPLISLVLLLGLSTPVSAAVPPGVSPLTVTVEGFTINAEWGASAEADDYEVELTGPSGSTIETVELSASFPGLLAGSYTVGVNARNLDGESGFVTQTANIVATPPGSPTGLSASVAGQDVIFTWNALDVDGGEAISYTAALNGGTPVPAAGGSGSFANPGPGDYTVTVTATNSAGSASSTSNQVTVAAPVTVPSAPLAFSANLTQDGQSVSISYAAPSSDGGSAILDYIVTQTGTASQVVTQPALGGLITGLGPGTYNFTVAARNIAGTGPATAAQTVTIAPPVTTPGAPQSVTATAASQTIEVSWSPPTNNGGAAITSYTITIPGVGSTTSTSSPVVFPGVAPGSYSASVTASNLAGAGPAGTSGPVAVAAPVSSPSVPRNVTATVTGQSLAVNWAAPTNDGGDPALSYTVALNGGSAQAATGGSFTFNDLAPGPYTATVTVSNSGGSNSATSGSVTVAAPVAAPSAPTDFSVSLTPNGQGVTIDYGPPGSDGGSPIIDYRITQTGVVSRQITETGLSTLITGLAPGTYNFAVAARNSVGLGPATPSQSVTIAVPISLPGTPSSVAASVSGSTISVSWSAPSDGGDPNLSYTVSLPGAGTKTTSGTNIQFTGVPAGTYSATVLATNSAGTGSAGTSNSVSVRLRPGPVTGLSAGAQGSSVIVAWKAPVSDGNSAITGYQVRLEQNGSVLATQDVSATTVAARFDARPPGNYRVVLSARNTLGIGPGVAVSVEVGSTAPSAPTNVSASAVFQNVTITWDPPLTIGNTALQGYRIEIGELTQTVGAGTRSAVFAEVPSGSYIAKVYARNSGGEGIAGESESVKTETVYAPFATADDLISRQYLDFLGRPADVSGLNYWGDILGGNRSQAPVVIENFMRSREFAPRRSIARLYLAFFDRAPDRGGFDYWAGQLRAGGSLNDVATAFAVSPEFVTTYGDLNDAEFVALVYNNVLLRSPDIDGFRFWVAQLQKPSVSRGDVMVAFSESPEFVRNSNPAVNVIMTYRGMLDRSPDSSGFAYWVGQVAGNPNSLRILIANFLVSAEYSNRVG